MKKSLIFMAVCAMIAVASYIKAESGDYSTLGYDSVNGYSFWRVNSSGHLIPGVASTLDIGTAALPVRVVYAGTITGTGAVSGTTITGTGIVQGAGVVSTSYITPAQKTIAEMDAITPGAKGQIYGCSNCAAVALCISTGATRGGFAIITDTSTHCS